VTREITLLTQQDCALCEHAKRVLARVAADHPITVTEIDLRTGQGAALALDAGVMFAPGVLLDGRPFSYGRLSERRLRKTLKTESTDYAKGRATALDGAEG
jgi:hypothetical protein